MLRIDSLVKTFRSGADTVRAIDDVTITVERGELVVLLGPSGCGKTTLLRCIAGLESAERGLIRFDERTVYDGEAAVDVPPNKRNIGMVFQSYALWPHKTVRKNLAYPLRVRGMKDALREGWVEQAATLVDCGHLLDRYPGQLSGGQQQRVALARGLVARPDILLFDEPLSNLDALLRTQVRNELHELHERIGFTGVYVTHDQSEALALGDRLAVMRAGRLEQVGPPAEIYKDPASEYVANFVGFANVIELTRSGTGWGFEPTAAVVDELPVDRNVEKVHLRFRPEFGTMVRLGGAPSGHIALPARYIDRVYAGTHDEITLACGSHHVMIRAAHSEDQHDLGEDVCLAIPLTRARLFEAGGQAL